MHLSIPVLLLATAITTLAAALQTAIGMGMGLVAGPLLVMVSPGFVPGPTLCGVMALSGVIAWRERAAIDAAILRQSLLGLLLGSAIATVLLPVLIRIGLPQVFAVLILGAVGLSLSGVRIPAGRWALLIGGTASGVLGTLSGAHGPPIALVLQHEAPARLRATLCAFFTVGCAIALAMLAVSGAFRASTALAGVALLPGVGLGIMLGPRLARYLDPRRGRIAVLAISALSALALLFR